MIRKGFYFSSKTEKNKGDRDLKKKSDKRAFVKKSSEPENPREFWNGYRPFLHGKTKQANGIIITENNDVINDKRETIQCALYSKY